MTTAYAPSRVLIAIRPTDMSILWRTLGSEFEVVVCHSLEEALAQFSEDIGMIVCGVHFDDGAMFDLLRAAKADPKTRAAPFFLMINEGAAYSDAIIEGIRLAAKSLGAVALTDLVRLKREAGEQQAYEKLRRSVRDVLERRAKGP